MSKSIGNVVCPSEILGQLLRTNVAKKGEISVTKEKVAEALKLYILVKGPLNGDSNFCLDDFEKFYGYFVDEFVNVYHRILGRKILENFIENPATWVENPNDLIFLSEIENLLSQTKILGNESVTKKWSL
jgi:methionyl-tRNA synthetase